MITVDYDLLHQQIETLSGEIEKVEIEEARNAPSEREGHLTGIIQLLEAIEEERPFPE
jgi:hypothetical protein